MTFKMLFLVLFFSLTFASHISSQDKTPPKAEEADEILKIDTQLVDVPVVVTDKNGTPLLNLNARLAESVDLQFIDVRRAGEFENGHAPRTKNLTLSDLEKLIVKLDPTRPTFVICQGGYRSSAATSVLEREGFTELYNISGGTAGWMKAGLAAE